MYYLSLQVFREVVKQVQTMHYFTNAGKSVKCMAKNTSPAKLHSHSLQTLFCLPKHAVFIKKIFTLIMYVYLHRFHVS